MCKKFFSVDPAGTTWGHMPFEPHHTERKNKKRRVVYYDLQNVYLTTALPLASMQTLMGNYRPEGFGHST
jgi:hypothetical protein